MPRAYVLGIGAITGPNARREVIDRSATIDGRDDVLRLLAETVAEARAGASGLLVTGEAGMGKTTLLEAAAGMAEGFTLLRAAGVQVEADLPFAGLHQLLGPLLPLPVDLPDRARRVLESALAIGESTAHDEFAVAAAVLALLGVTAAETPLMMLLDDAHWIDSESLHAILFAFRRLHAESMALVIGARPGAAPLDGRGLREVRLEPLDGGAARAVAARHRAAELGDAWLDRIVELAGGVPLALVELAIRGETLPRAEPGLSADGLVERLFGRRVERLSEPAATAALLATLDEPGELDAYVTAGESLGATRDAWEELERSGILDLRRGRAEFVHPLLREAVSARAPAIARRAAHAALGSAMAARGDEDRAVWHQAGAAIGADEELAHALEHAAGNYRARAGHLTAARALVQSARLSSTAVARARRLLLAAEDARHGGQPDWGGSLAEEAIRASADQALQARGELAQAHAEAWRGSAEAAFRRYRRVADRVSGNDPELAALALGYAGGVAIVAGDLPGAFDAVEQARRIPAGALSEQTLISIRESLGFVLALRGETAAARGVLDEVAKWYERRPDRIGAEYVAEALMWLGDHQRVRLLLDELAADARRLGAGALLIQTLVLRAELGYRTGRWPSALADAMEAVNLADDARQDVHLAYALAGLAILQAVTGDEEAARGHADRARASARRHELRVVEESACFALGALELAAGRAESALSYLEPVAAGVAETGRGEPAVSLWPAELIEAELAAGRREEAITALDALDLHAQRTGGAWARGVVERNRGVIAGEEDYEAAFIRAAELHVACGMPFELARTRLAYGQRLRRSGRRIDSRAQLRDARATFETLRAVRWLERAERELAGSGERLRRGPGSDRDELTPQELQIAQIIATGASNRQAAASLFLSPKTIETHLTRIYRKLGIQSRSQLVALMGKDATLALGA